MRGAIQYFTIVGAITTDFKKRVMQLLFPQKDVMWTVLVRGKVRLYSSKFDKFKSFNVYKNIKITTK